MAATQELRERRANIWEQMKEVMDLANSEGRDLTAEETEKYDRAETDLDKIEGQIERSEKHEKRSATLDHVDRTGVVPPGAGDDDTDDEERQAAYDRVFRSWMRDGSLDMTAEDRATLRAGFVQDKEMRAAGVGTGSAGGYAVPLAFRNVFIETLKWYGPMLDVAETIFTDSGVNLPWPTADDTGNVGAILGENTQISEQDVVLGTASLDAYMYTSKLVRVSYQLLQDRADFDTWLAKKLGQRIGRILNQHFTTGTGSSQPDGIVTSATVATTGTGSFATTGGIGFDDIIDLIESLDPAYGNGPGLQFMLHQSVRKAVRKLKNTQGGYLWQPSVQQGTPDMLEGYPIKLNNDMATLAVSSKSIGFGNIEQAYVIRIVKGLTTARLTERFADFLQVGFFGFERADGTMQDANAFKVFRTTASA